MRFKSFITIAFIAFLGSSCNESFLDINTNPNVLPTALPNYVLTGALNTSASNLVLPNETGSYWSGQWSQSNSYILVPQTFSYTFTDGDFNYWDGFYDNLADYEFVINNADANSQKFLKGPARVMKAFLMQHLVDLYGNVPYTEAWQGVKILAPKFDDQKAIYESLITSLDQAIVDLKANAFTSAFTGSDIVFKGNTTKWIKFANGVKLRILMRQARVAGRDTYIKTEIGKIVTEGSGFLTTEDVASGGPGLYQPTAGKLNPVYDRWGYDAAGAVRALGRFPRLTAYLVNSLKDAGDTFRLKRYGYATGGEGSTAGVSAKAEIAANYVGVPFGASSGYVATAVSPIGPSLLVKGSFDKAFIFMTAAEVLFNLAEAKERFGASITLTGDAKTYFESGMVQSFRTLGTPTANAAVFIGSGKQDYDYTASTNKLKAIATQKWLALVNFNGLEAWSEYRRTGFPLIPQTTQLSDTKRPVRLFYPSTEAGSNGTNVKAQGAIDVFNSRLFWDVD